MHFRPGTELGILVFLKKNKMKKNEKKIFRHAEYESARRDLNFFMGKELELLVIWLFFN